MVRYWPKMREICLLFSPSTQQGPSVSSMVSTGSRELERAFGSTHSWNTARILGGIQRWSIPIYRGATRTVQLNSRSRHGGATRHRQIVDVSADLSTHFELPDKQRHRRGTMLTWAAPVGGARYHKDPACTKYEDGPSNNIRREMESQIENQPMASKAIMIIILQP